MRKALKNLGSAERHRFEATVQRFGTKTAYKGPPVPTVLLTDVTCDGRAMTDHLWMTRGKWAEPLREGMRIAFDARVGTYRAGYRGRRQDWDLPPERVDYKVERPTRLVILDCPAGRAGQMSLDQGETDE